MSGRLLIGGGNISDMPVVKDPDSSFIKIPDDLLLHIDSNPIYLFWNFTTPRNSTVNDIKSFILDNIDVDQLDYMSNDSQNYFPN